MSVAHNANLDSEDIINFLHNSTNFARAMWLVHLEANLPI